jgi:hypothetical protein
MKSKLFLAALAATGAVAVPVATAQSPYYQICTAGQTPGAAPYYCIPKTTKQAVKRVTLVVRPKVDRKKPYQYRVSGKIVRSGTATCKGSVAVKVKQGKRQVAKATFKSRANCKYNGSVRIKKSLKGRSGTLKFQARFNGNTKLKPKSSKVVTAKFVKPAKKHKKK